MKKTFLRRALVVLLVMALGVCASVSVNAFTTVHTYTIDNDDAQGYSNDREGFDTWFQSDNLYYQDARKQACDSSNYAYSYNFPTYYRYTTIYGKVSAYLYNPSFTDPAAWYGINDYLSYAFSDAGYINQDLAAAGWNVIGTATTEITLPDGYQCTNAVEVRPSTSNNTGKTCGADAIKIQLGY